MHGHVTESIIKVNIVFFYLFLYIVKLNFYWTEKIPELIFVLYIPVENRPNN